MSTRKPASIKKKLLLISIMTTGAALLLANIIFMANEMVHLRRVQVNSLTLQAQIIGNNSTVALEFNNKKDAETVLGALSFAPYIVRAGVFTQERALFAAYQRPGVTGPPRYPDWAGDGHRFELNRLTIVKPIDLDGETIGSIIIEADLREFYLSMARYAGVALIVFAAAIIFVFVLLSELQKAISDPILDLAVLTRTVSQDKDYSVRTAIKSEDEIGVLAEGLNEMLSQIQRRDQELEQHRKHLEDQVSLRTAELTQVNHLLQEKLEEQRRAEQALHESETRYRLLFESAQDAIFILEAEGTQAGNVVAANKAAADAHGYTADELMKLNIKDLDDPEAAQNAPNIIRRIRGGEWIKTEVRHRRKDGTVFPVDVSAGLLEIVDHKYILAFDRDITERKKAEERLQRYAADLKQSNEDVLSFAYIVSHDLRAPLVSIKGFTGELQMALKKIEATLDTCRSHLSEKESAGVESLIRGDVPEAMKFISSSVSRMDGLINAILTLSRMGHRELKPEPVDMKEVVNTILNSLAHQIEQRKTVVTLGELPMITADKLAMKQITGNLLDNALKYLDPVREGTIAVSAGQNGDEIVFRISDNGRGIAQEDLHKVFEIFRRAGKQDVAGEGMGLAYVKALVRRQGGRIWCESEPGQGSTFSFTIPDKIITAGSESIGTPHKISDPLHGQVEGS